MSEAPNASQDNNQPPVDPVQQRMDTLLHQAVQKALALVGEFGEYYPFAVTRSQEGEFALTQARIDDDTPPGIDLITQKLIRGLATEAAQGKYTSVAIVSDVRVRKPETGLYTDAIRVSLEDRQNEPLDFFLPYARLADGKIETDNLLVQQTIPMVFPREGEAKDATKDKTSAS